ncbi:hypothetical protein Pen02_67680 [Plantactinospora endophytica]|uniref:Uncharacterized protein n=1 Tax=Plantactinospora endophytica TaxID=673535 RepID=A0ABQ4EC74_9ACTN|nr:hypothetical protein Pen02_67680 [Plantactinospora endophytica]
MRAGSDGGWSFTIITPGGRQIWRHHQAAIAFIFRYRYVAVQGGGQTEEQFPRPASHAGGVARKIRPDGGSLSVNGGRLLVGDTGAAPFPVVYRNGRTKE